MQKYARHWGNLDFRVSHITFIKKNLWITYLWSVTFKYIIEIKKIITLQYFIYLGSFFTLINRNINISINKLCTIYIKRKLIDM